METNQIDVKKPLRRYKGSTIDTGEGITEQSHKNECDMNFILRDYKRTGFIRHAKENEGKYDDISVQDFQEALFIVTEANQMFENLPAQVRKEFGNNPSQFLDFVQNPENADKLQKMGIIRGNDGLDMNGVPTKAPLYKEPSQEVQTPTMETTEGGNTEATP